MSKKSVGVTEETYKKLTSFRGKLIQNRSKPVTMSQAIDCLLDLVTAQKDAGQSRDEGILLTDGRTARFVDKKVGKKK